MSACNCIQKCEKLSRTTWNDMIETPTSHIQDIIQRYNIHTSGLSRKYEMI